MARLIAFAKASFLQIPPGANIFKDFLVKIHNYHSIIVIINDSMLDGTRNGTCSQD